MGDNTGEAGIQQQAGEASAARMIRIREIGTKVSRQRGGQERMMIVRLSESVLAESLGYLP